jgi:putative transposase
MAEWDIEVDHSSVRRARIILAGIELMHVIRKGQMHDNGIAETVAKQFYSLII